MSRYTIAFNGTVAASSELVLVSKRINFPFALENFHCSFALGQDRTTLLSFFHSFDDVAPTTGFPTGTNLLRILGQSSFIVGDDATNLDSFPHTVDVLIVVNSMSLKELDKLTEVIAVG